MVIVIFGPVAAGKSTLACALQAALPGAVLLPEPTDCLLRLGLIADLAANRPGTALSLQLTVLLARLQGMLAAAATPPQAPSGGLGAAPPAVICDGHLSLDGPLYVPEHIRAGRMNITDVCVHAHALAIVERLLPPPMRQPRLYVYLRTPADACMQRCRQRARPGERGLDLAFFQRMLRNCDAAADDLPPDRVLRIDDAAAADDDVTMTTAATAAALVLAKIRELALV